MEIIEVKELQRGKILMLVRIKVCEIDFCTFHLMGKKNPRFISMATGSKVSCRNSVPLVENDK